MKNLCKRIIFNASGCIKQAQQHARAERMGRKRRLRITQMQIEPVQEEQEGRETCRDKKGEPQRKIETATGDSRGRVRQKRNLMVRHV